MPVGRTLCSFGRGSPPLKQPTTSVRWLKPESRSDPLPRLKMASGVDISDRDQAEAQVALGDYVPSAKGIQVTDGGVDSAFLSARTRDQMADKREWQECELQLERLNFIERATVCSSSQNHSAFATDEDVTISVTLGLRHGFMLDDAQGRTVATLVRSRFNVPLENITIVDEHGNLLHDGSDSIGGFSGEDLYAYKRRYDLDAERRANKSLEMALGKGMARVTVNSVWSYDEFESIKESAVPKDSAPYYVESTKKDVAGASSGSGGPAGVSSNITQDFGNENAAIGAGEAAGSSSTSTTDVTRSVVGRTTEHRLSRTPLITRLNVALVADDSVAASLTKLEGLVKAAVGFDATRSDYFESFTTPLASIERDEEGTPVLPEAPLPLEEPNQYLELALEHGVELIAALAFIIVLLKSLRGAKSTKAEAAAAAATQAAKAAEEAENIDPELLAKAQVEELVRSDPEKVSEILASWATASEEHAGAA